MLDQFDQHDGFYTDDIKEELGYFFSHLQVFTKDDLKDLGISTPLYQYTLEEINDIINEFRKGDVLIVLDEKDTVIFLIEEE